MAGRQHRVSLESHAAYHVACFAEALSRIFRIIGTLLVFGLILGSPAIALYEYDQQNEPTPNLTPNDLWYYASYLVPVLLILLAFGFLGPWIRRRKMELTPGFAEIDKWERTSKRDRLLLGENYGQWSKPISMGKVGRIVAHRSGEGRRLGIVYRTNGNASPTLRKKRRRHQKKYGPKQGILHTLRRALGFSRKGRNRPAWWQAWLRLS
jgi:hypothetical protein